MLLPAIYNIAEICYQKGIRDVVLCPGSRSAALTIAFVRHGGFKTYSISDERSAAFIALGMAQVSKLPVVLVCTSGTAAYNFAPAITEAFFQGVPLLVLTADRPPEWIHQHDGQTIYQQDIYGKHVKKSYQLPADYQHLDSVWHIERTLNEAINLCTDAPVHINVPIREPFYPDADEVVCFDKNVRVIQSIQTQKTLSPQTWDKLLDIWNSAETKMIALGQVPKNETLQKCLQSFSDELGAVIVADVISNTDIQGGISSQDSFLSKQTASTELKPELLITVGGSFISKNLKTYLRKNKPLYHWHIEENEHLIDTFQTLTHKINVVPDYFFDKLFTELDRPYFRGGEEPEANFEYQALWQKFDIQAKKQLHQFLNDEKELNDFSAVYEVMNKLPDNSIVHLGNSMSVRYANLMANYQGKNIEFFANRGTSGIDGTVSTAVGEALKTDKIVTCLVGDVAFFYDRNAFWNTYVPDNLRIILLNNHAGNIFSMIDGPAKQPELKTYFETTQTLTAKSLAAEFGLNYQHCNHLSDLETSLQTLFESSQQVKILEIETNADTNVAVFKKYKAL